MNKVEMLKEECKNCPLIYDICPFLKRELNRNVERGGKSYDCPLVEPTDVGREIDKWRERNETINAANSKE